ncbi:VpaChn25_0724 family phage protein [Hypericibacter sp.]|uniref:VpaChn25_0724 family phage protein n=1 Tax=Hypericibacter sp. TaxID=2705401 RepID=UPI003D6D7AC7
MTSYIDHLREHWRITILRVLEQAPGYRGNDSVLHQALHAMGHVTTRDQVKSELTWLQGQGYITVETMGSLMVATITDRGRDVALGNEIVPGVKRPGPN